MKYGLVVLELLFLFIFETCFGQVVGNSVSFAMGLATTLALLGVGASFAGKAYGQIGQGLPVAASFLAVVMGLNLLEVHFNFLGPHSIIFVTLKFCHTEGIPSKILNVVFLLLSFVLAIGTLFCSFLPTLCKILELLGMSHYSDVLAASYV